ncbi:ParB family chromosome partitioning protein [Streptomyces sp. KhCrAH-43]|uniref:ParB/RepB/Spo0J family partition protein n=1 Tax=unclassified Streptomyces TaxID=2593676 RepID=UPI0003610422|nr:ParB/RepB/Spo0J family partition protein [Streptomyces sp. KhCrAH-43]MYS32910.1 ParB/RepB/Spo0J family partition protein [Streptomyces sp. SID4920]MYX64299.1 ParB/RepB/Spo0J family partition protein [Streptomyces sp. SID8373]RAJ47869.1 ParB family chromosome partitioning protein [Streptomyces sp. KhCrAH-43]
MSRSTAADRTGPSPAFGAVQARSTRGQITDSVVGAHPKEIAADRVAENPGNPRDDYDSDYIDQLAQNMREVGQIQPATVMSRLAFLVVHPEHKDTVPVDYAYVVIDGHCRRQAALRAGIDLRITVDDTSAGTPEDLLAAALSANHFRKDLTPIEEARAIEALVAFHGSAAAVISVLGGALNQAWVSTRRALLNLPEEIQQQVAAKQVPIAIARKAGSMATPEEQTDYVQKEMNKRAAQQAQKPKPVRGRAAAAAKRKAPQPSPEPPQSGPGGSSSPITVTDETRGVPEPRGAAEATSPSEPAIDWTDAGAVTSAIRTRCSLDVVQQILRNLADPA